MNKEFKFRFKKHPTGKIVKFNVSQLDGHRAEVCSDFIAIFLHQLKVANGCQILLEWENKVITQKWIDEINEKNKEKETTFLELNLHRAIIDYCCHNVNLSAISQHKTILSMLEFYYAQKDSSAIK